MEQTIAVIRTIKGITLCTINTTSLETNSVNGYPFTRKQAFDLIPYLGQKVKVQLGHNQPIPTYTATIKHVDIGKRIVKITFDEGAFQSQEKPLPETARQTNFSLRNVWNKLLQVVS